MIEINGIQFEAIEGVRYKYDYAQAVKKIEDGEWNKLETFRKLILNDLWFIIYFVMGIREANHPFVVKMCQEVEGDSAGGRRVKTLDIWARYHYKSTIITVAETVQYHLKNPEHCTCIFSYKKPAAEDFVDSVRRTYEYPIMVACFPDILYENPYTQAHSWSLQNGITLKRASLSRKEATVEASGLIEGMLTGKHFERKVFDDVETADMAESPDEMDKCFSRFEMADNLGMGKDWDIDRVIGTFYSHEGPLMRIKSSGLYKFRRIPCTDNGLSDGKPVLVSEEKHEELKQKLHYNSQHLCDPTPAGERKLDSSHLQEIEPEMIPADLFYFMVVDPAGDEKNKKRSDDWGIWVVGVEPKIDQIGASNVYIVNGYLDTLKEVMAPDVLARLYCSVGLVMKTGYERNMNTTPGWLFHFQNLLKTRGRHLSEEAGNLVRLTHGGRNKHLRIETALALPLMNGKIHISKSVPMAYRQRLKSEIDKFPFWLDNGLDALAYLYDILKDYRFYVKEESQKPYKTRSYAMV